MIKYSLTGFILCLMGMAGFSQLCTTREWHVHQTRSAKIDTTRISGIAENFNFWPTGKVITVGFVNGTTEQRVAVLAIAKEWEKHGNIRFEAADVKDAIVRIRLTHSGANYTYIGTDILKADPGENNMQLDQSLFGKNHAELRKVVLHQFGHVLGMVHEFNPPDEGAQWDKVHIQKEFRRAGWSALDIENNLYGLYTHRITNGWFWDRHSIMHLGIAYRHLNKGIPIYVNEEISEGDSMWLGSRYPFVNSGINKRPPFTLSL